MLHKRKNNKTSVDFRAGLKAALKASLCPAYISQSPWILWMFRGSLAFKGIS